MDYDNLKDAGIITFICWDAGEKYKLTGKVVCVDRNNQIVVQVGYHEYKHIPQCRIYSFDKATKWEYFKYRLKM
jgi:hypothetical protein